MNIRILHPFLIFAFLIITAYITADMVNIIGKGALQTLPSFRMSERIKKQQPTIQASVEEAGEETNIASLSAALPSVKLLGTVTGALPYAVFLDIGSNKQEIYRLKRASTGIRLDPRDVEGALSDLNKVMTQARVVPNMVEGKTSGYRIFNIAPASIYTKLGLQNNDVVERVNGVEIKSPDALYQLFHQIKNERKIALDFNRSGKRESISIEIR